MADDAKNSPFNAAFGKLASIRNELESNAPQRLAPVEEKAPARAVVRMERKGRGGKEVTVVEQLNLPRAKLETWLKDLKQSLGCGGALERETLVLQGDHRERLRALLEKKGVRRISVG